MKNIAIASLPEQITGKSQSHLTTLSSGHQVHKEILQPITALQQAALKSGFKIAIASGYRDFERQLNIWNAKFSGIRPVYDRQLDMVDMDSLNDWQKVQAILHFSALPGSSRHHWGTDFDFYDRAAIDDNYQLQLSPQEYTHCGPFCGATNWLHTHAQQFGFYFPYQGAGTGVAPEPWHLSYFPIANQYLNKLADEPKLLFDLIVNEDIEGKSAILHNFEYIIDNYILNVVKTSE